MARNMVQFQKGLSEAAFEDRYGTEEKCRALLIASRWPDGFECPACGGRSYSEVKTRGLFQCSTCHRQTSPIAGTIFASTHVPLRLWFRAMYHLTQSKQGISSIELGRRLGVTQTTAWKIKHKLAQVMMERDCHEAPERAGRAGRRLCRWRTLRRQAGPRGAWQDAVRCRRRDHTRGQASASEAASCQAG
jgi:ribosomal protein L37AE/L43A